MTRNERKELEKLEELELKKLALDLELPVIQNRAQMIESILMKRNRLAPGERSPHGKNHGKGKK